MRKQLIQRGLVAVSTLAATGLAMAQAAPTVDTAPITGAGAAIAAVGAAVFAVMVGIKLWKWIRRAL